MKLQIEFTLIESSHFSDAETEEFKALEEVSRKQTREERHFHQFKEVLKQEPDQVSSSVLNIRKMV